MPRLGTDNFPEGFEETWQALLDFAVRPLVPAPLLAAQALEVTRGADWPVRRAAMEALLRRAKSAENEQLAAVGVPARGRPFGNYTVARPAAGSRRRKDQRPYAVYLESLVPFIGSCDCPDFLRGSLGLCKHLIAVVHHVRQRQALLAAALSAPPAVSEQEARLSWDAVRPLLGTGDRLLGLRWHDGQGERAAAASARRARAHLGEDRLPAPSECPDATRANALALTSLTAPKKRRGGGVALARTARVAPLAPARQSPRSEPQVWTLPEELLLDPERRHRLLEDLARLVADASSGVAIDPAVRALVAEELERSARVQRGRAEAPRLLGQLDSLGRKLYPYQLEGVERFITHGRLLLADDMGLGKTTQAIAACHVLHRSKKVRRGLLIVPAALKPQWVREWQATTDIAITSVDGSPESRSRVYRQPKTPFLVMGYEQLLKDLSLVHEFAPDVVVLDEAQRIKNYATKTAVYVKSLTPSYRLVLTGTPMENRLEELASVLDWVDDIALTPKWRLEPWHTFHEGDAGDGRTGARNLDTLRARMAPCMLRRVRREVLSQLPSRTDTRVPVPMTPEQQSEHDDLSQPIATLIATAARRPLRQPEFLKLMSLLTTQRIISNGLGQLRFDEVWPALQGARPEPALLEGLFMPKLAELRRIIRDVVLEQGRKVVVFSQWRRMLRLAAWSLEDVLGDAGQRAVFFTGAESPRQRSQSIVEFHDDPKTSVMFLSDAGGVGLNLQHAASACINLELPWNPAVVEQRIGRIHRLGQKSPIDVYNLVTEQGIEARIAALIATKKALFGGLFDGTTDSVRFEGQGSFLSDVEKLVAPLPDLPEAAAPPPNTDDETDADESPTVAESALDAALTDALPSEASLSKGGAPSNPVRSGDPAQAAPRAERPKEVAELLRALQVTRAPDGTVTISAPPSTADALLSLLQGLTELVAKSSSIADSLAAR
jgi:superfamily II DNA or RNA helicase